MAASLSSGEGKRNILSAPWLGYMSSNLRPGRTAPMAARMKGAGWALQGAPEGAWAKHRPK
nr:unnamed protein product [Digitaria exilis]